MEILFLKKVTVAVFGEVFKYADDFHVYACVLIMYSVKAFDIFQYAKIYTVG